MLFKVIASMIVRQVLGSPEVKKRVFEALRYQAGKSETKIDDEFVDMLAEAWEVVVPVVAGKAA